MSGSDNGGNTSVGIDALFVLGCGCILDGCSDSDPGQKWQAGVRNGLLHCSTHKSWETLVDVVSLTDPGRSTEVER